MASYSPGSFSCDLLSFHLGEGLWNNAAFPELLIYGSNVPDKVNIAIQPFPKDV